MSRYKTFEEFWPFYVFQHMNRVNRRLHFIGMSAALGIMAYWFSMAVVAFFEDSVWSALFYIMAPLTFLWYFLGALVAGYGGAWAGHFFFEKNRPATFWHPLWSFFGDLRMYRLMWRGDMDDEVVAMETCIKAFPDWPLEEQLKFQPMAKDLTRQFKEIFDGLSEKDRNDLREWAEKFNRKKEDTDEK